MSRIRIIGTEKEEKLSFEYVHQQQEECQVLSQIKTCLKSKRVSLKTTDSSIKSFEKELSRCFIGNDGVLRRKGIDGNFQIIITQKLTTKVNRALLQPITTQRPGELVTMDIVEYPH